jgi:hypothetical protein
VSTKNRNGGESQQVRGDLWRQRQLAAPEKAEGNTKKVPASAETRGSNPGAFLCGEARNRTEAARKTRTAMADSRIASARPNTSGNQGFVRWGIPLEAIRPHSLQEPAEARSSPERDGLDRRARCGVQARKHRCASALREAACFGFNEASNSWTGIGAPQIPETG